MKKTFLGLAVASIMMFGGFTANAQSAVMPDESRYIVDKIIMYLPNRIMDLLDVVSIDLETGAAVKAGVRMTYAFGFGFGVGPTGRISWDYKRTCGLSLNEESQLYYFCDGFGSQMQNNICGNLPEYSCKYSGIRNFDTERVFSEKIKDYWAIEAKAVVLAGARIVIHPVNIVDCICGLFCYDLAGNDMTLLY